jgi:hypothetical protein
VSQLASAVLSTPLLASSSFYVFVSVLAVLFVHASLLFFEPVCLAAPGTQGSRALASATLHPHPWTKVPSFCSLAMKET